jgi:hypothetical protein
MRRHLGALRFGHLALDDSEELGEVDSLAHVLVDGRDQVEDLLVRRLLPHGLQHLPQLPGVDGPAVVLVVPALL